MYLTVNPIRVNNSVYNKKSQAASFKGAPITSRDFLLLRTARVEELQLQKRRVQAYIRANSLNDKQMLFLNSSIEIIEKGIENFHKNTTIPDMLMSSTIKDKEVIKLLLEKPISWREKKINSFKAKILKTLVRKKETMYKTLLLEKSENEQVRTLSNFYKESVKLFSEITQHSNASEIRKFKVKHLTNLTKKIKQLHNIYLFI